MQRRRLLRGIAAAPLLAASIASTVSAAALRVARVVVVGGGFGGLAAAHALRRHLPTAHITLVERRRRYGVAAFSNLAVVGAWPAARLQHAYTAAAAASEITMHYGEVQRVEENRLRLADGSVLPFDRAILAPGAEFDYTQVAGADAVAVAQRMPHAYDGGAQVSLLQRQLAAMPSDGVLMILPPPAPYSCSPAPYDRAGLIAHYMEREKPRGKVLILDQKEQFAQQTLFSDYWNAHYRGRIEWLSAQGGGALERIDAAAGVVHTEFGAEHADVVNYIPPQRAAALVRASGLADASGWCPVHAQTMESTQLRGVYVVGDAAALAPAPKTGSCAMSQGKLAAAALARSLSDAVTVPDGLQSECFSHIAPHLAFSERSTYHLADGVQVAQLHLTARHTPPAQLEQIARRGVKWHSATMHELFVTSPSSL